MATQAVAKGAKSLGTPTNGDSIHLLGGSATIDESNLDWSGVDAAANVIVPFDFNGSLGTSSVPFVAKVSTLFEYAASGGDCYWTSDGFSDDVSALLLMPRGSNGNLYLTGSTGTITQADVFGGALNVAASTDVTTLYLGTNGIGRIYDVGTDPTAIYNFGGSLELMRGATTLHHALGSSRIMSDNANAITTLDIWGPGVRIEGTGGATITNCNCYAGIPDTSKLNREFTISNTLLNLSLPGAREFENHPLITHSSVTYIGGR